MCYLACPARSNVTFASPLSFPATFPLSRRLRRKKNAHTHAYTHKPRRSATLPQYLSTCHVINKQTKEGSPDLEAANANSILFLERCRVHHAGVACQPGGGRDRGRLRHIREQGGQEGWGAGSS